MNPVSSRTTALAKLTVPGMGSDHCAGIVKRSLKRLEGMGDITTNIASHRVEATYDPDKLKLADLRIAVEKAGYDVAQVASASEENNAENDADIEDEYLRQALKRLWIAGVPATLIMLLMVPHMFWQPIPGYLVIVAVLAFPVVFLYGRRLPSPHASQVRASRGSQLQILP